MQEKKQNKSKTKRKTSKSECTEILVRYGKHQTVLHEKVTDKFKVKSTVEILSPVAGAVSKVPI